MTLRVIACAAPQFPEGQPGDMALSSGDPASLFNACRYAAQLAANGAGAWADSNWSTSREERRRTTLMFSDRDEMEQCLANLLPDVQPNLFLIGAMSICTRGAIETATFVRKILGDDVCIVLGGRHANETIYQIANVGEVHHHPASPLLLMSEGMIEDVFDVVIAGDGEFAIAGIGELVANVTNTGKPARDARLQLDSIDNLPGRWIAGTSTKGQINTISSAGPAIDYNTLPSGAEMFGISAAFDIFDYAPTAHVFSDIGGGCIYDCTFCSERRSVIGAPRQLKSSADRLYKQIRSARDLIDNSHGPKSPMGAFVEDSTFLGWSSALMQTFGELNYQSSLRTRIGGQATIDQITRKSNDFDSYKEFGLEYLFIGLETPVPNKIGGLHKDVGSKNGSWMDRAEQAMDLLGDAGIDVGISLLFGLGEGPAERDMMFRALERWRSNGLLKTISMNWAVQHPLKSSVPGPKYTYLDWPLNDSHLLSLMRHFGEASDCYPVAGADIPTVSEVTRIIDATKSVMAQPTTSLVT